MELNSIFTSDMVLQGNKPIRFFGSGKGTAKINFLGIEQTCVAENDEGWSCEFPSMPYGGPYSAIISLNGEETTLQNIYIGEVLLLSGQSNMEFQIMNCKNEPQDLVPDPNLRYYMAVENFGKWQVCDPEVLQTWSSVGYHTARKLSIELKVKVGLVGCFQGASIIESWISEEVFREHEEFQLPLEDKCIDHVNPDYAAFNGTGFLYETRVKRVAPFSVGTVLWYQGESDSSVKEAAIYDKEVAVMIDLWRRTFLDSELKFVVIQIADYLMRDDAGWKGIQAAQERVFQAVENTRLVKSADLCEKDDIHPPTKAPLGNRIAKAILQW